MESIYNIIKKYGEGKGAEAMWRSVAAISDSVEKNMDECARKQLARNVYKAMAGGHYNEDFAKEDVAKMYYEDESGKKQYAPYWTPEQVSEVYDTVQSKIPDYNMWDFYVALNMTKSDMCPMLKEWFPAATPEEMTKKIVEATVVWLNDADNPYGSEKIWGYLNK